jgi:hypothetical protein
MYANHILVYVGFSTQMSGLWVVGRPTLHLVFWGYFGLHYMVRVVLVGDWGPQSPTKTLGSPKNCRFRHQKKVFPTFQHNYFSIGFKLNQSKNKSKRKPFVVDWFNIKPIEK